MNKSLQIKRINVADIVAADYNPRKDLQPGDPEYQMLEKSIAEFGYVEPMVWNRRTGTLVSGHQRFKVLKAQGVTEVDVSVVDLPLEKEKTLAIGLNKIRGSWDDEKLSALLAEISAVPNFDVELAGFDLPEISKILDERSDTKDEGDADHDAAAQEIEEPVTQPGEILQLGPHRVMCADASVPENLEKLFQGEQADLYWSDWPYRVAYDSTARPGSSGKKLWEKIHGDDFSQEEYDTWMLAVLTFTAPFLKDGAAVYIWSGHREFWTMQAILKTTGFKPSCVITWAKPSISPSYADYQWQTEFCLYGWKVGAPHAWYGKAESSLWEVNREAASTLEHPTMKPQELVLRALRNSSKRGDLISDSCLGSGSCLIGADTLGRRCFGFEIDARYCDVIARRYIKHVGKDNVSKELRDKYVLGGQSDAKETK